jgi:hypothetical protein
MKSVHVLLAEAHEALRKAGKMTKYREIVPIAAGTPIEVQLNCANAVLAGKMEEAVRVVKNNGDGSLERELRESAEPLSETARPDSAKRIKKLTESGMFSEAEAKVFASCRSGEDANGKACTISDPLVPAGLSVKEAREYKFARAIGFNEAQAQVFVKTKTQESRPNRF